MTDFENWLCGMPKAELHLHIDGTLQAHRLLELARKNNVAMPYRSVEEVEQAYDFTDLQSFLDLYYLGASVLRDADDFYWLMKDYLQKCVEQNIRHAEIMIEPQTYAPQGVSFGTVMEGFRRAIGEYRKAHGISVVLILSFLRHLSEAEALETLRQAEVFGDEITAIGLASSERGNPPEKFRNVYRRALEMGYRATVHAGEEGPAQYVWDAIHLLGAQRIDHGVRATEDPELINYLVEHQLALTVCPLSNVRLCVYDSLQQHPLLDMLDQGVKVTVNSDDPAYFGGFVNENFLALSRELSLSADQAERLAANSFSASFLTEQERQALLLELSRYCAA